MEARLNVPELCTSEEALVKSTIENKQMCVFSSVANITEVTHMVAATYKSEQFQ